MVGLIAAIELGRSCWKIRNAESIRKPATVKPEQADDAAENKPAEIALPPGTSQLLESVLAEDGSDPPI